MASSLRGQIITGFSLLILVLLSVVLISALQVRAHRSDLAKMEEHGATASLLDDSRFNVTLADLLLERYVTSGNDQVVPVIRSSMATTVESLADALADEEMRGDEDEIATLKEAVAGADFLSETAEQVIALRQSGDMQGARGVLDAASPRIGRFGIVISGAAEFEAAEVAELRADAGRTGDLALLFLVISGVIGTSLALAASTFIARSILRPLSSLESAALAVADGDLEARASIR